MAELGAIPIRFLVAAAGLALLSAVLSAPSPAEANVWFSIGKISVLVIANFTFSYGLAMAHAPAKVSWRGFLAYTGTSLLILAPAAVSLTLGLLFWSSGMIGLLLLLVGMTGLVFASLMVGWPALQAASTIWIGPARAWRSTRGQRGSLVATCLLIGGLNRLIFSPPEMSSPLADFLVRGGLALASTALFLLMIAVSITAYRHMAAQIFAEGSSG